MKECDHFFTYGEARAAALVYAVSGHDVQMVIYESETWPWREIITCFDVVVGNFVDGPGYIEEIDNR